jgi:hypothetical protein
MKKTTVRSFCECQAKLEATLDESRHVLSGWAIAPNNVREHAPAHSVDAENPTFFVGWLCAFCGRNTMRAFAGDALAWSDSAKVEPD